MVLHLPSNRFYFPNTSGYFLIASRCLAAVATTPPPPCPSPPAGEGRATPRVLGRQLTPPPPRGLRPTVSWGGSWRPEPRGPPPPPCPPLVQSDPLVHPPGPVGNCHFVNHPKIAQCSLSVLCVAPAPLLPPRCTYCDRTFSVAYLLMDLDSTTLFPPETDVLFIRSTVWNRTTLKFDSEKLCGAPTTCRLSQPLVVWKKKQLFVLVFCAVQCWVSVAVPPLGKRSPRGRGGVSRAWGVVDRGGGGNVGLPSFDCQPHAIALSLPIPQLQPCSITLFDVRRQIQTWRRGVAPLHSLPHRQQHQSACAHLLRKHGSIDGET